MPKRQGSRQEKISKKGRYDEIIKELNRLRQKLTESDSSDSEIQDEDGENEQGEEIEREEEDETASGVIEVVEQQNDTQEYIALLGVDPSAQVNKPEDIHESVAVRWSVFLKKGLPKDIKNEIIQKHPIPENCNELLAPKLNLEVNACLDEKALRQDNFLSNIQDQIGHSLAVIAKEINKILTTKSEDSKNTLSNLAEASQLLCNVHYAVSSHRKFNISPFLNYNSRKMAEKSERDELLLGKTFFEDIKTNQSILKAKQEIKAPSTFKYPIKGPRPQPTSTKVIGSLNSRRPPPTSRKKATTMHYRPQYREERNARRSSRTRNIPRSTSRQ